MARKIFSDHWTVSAAPVPGNIIWEHLSIDPESWWIRSFLINLVLLVFVIFVTTPTVLLTSLDQIKASFSKCGLGPSDLCSLLVLCILLEHYFVRVMAKMHTKMYTKFITMAGTPERGILGLTEYVFTDFFRLKKNQEYRSRKKT